MSFKSDHEIKQFTQDQKLLNYLVNQYKKHQKNRIISDNQMGKKANGDSQKNIENRAIKKEDLPILQEIREGEYTKEKLLNKRIKEIVERFEIFDWIQSIKGVGPVVIAPALAKIDIGFCKYVSQMWQVSGFNPSMIYGKKRIKESEYTPQKGIIISKIERSQGENEVIILTNDLVIGDKHTPEYLDPFIKDLKTAFISVATGIIQANTLWEEISQKEFNSLPSIYRKTEGTKSPKFYKFIDNSPKGQDYLKIYKDYKWRLMNSNKITSENRGNNNIVQIKWKDAWSSHIDAAAKRYMAKMFQIDFYKEWRRVEGYKVHNSFTDDKLGYSPHR